MKTPALKALEKYQQLVEVLTRELAAKEIDVEETKEEIKLLEKLVSQQ